jgi:hypothetical protein
MKARFESLKDLHLKYEKGPCLFVGQLWGGTTQWYNIRLGATTLSITTFNITTFSITTFSIMAYDTYHNSTQYNSIEYPYAGGRFIDLFIC